MIEIEEQDKFNFCSEPLHQLEVGVHLGAWKLRGGYFISAGVEWVLCYMSLDGVQGRV